MDPASHEFGRFRLDLRAHALFLEGNRVELPPRLFDLLLHLVQNAGRLVTREELMKNLWPDTFVADGTLSQSVWLVRKALGSEELIETVPRLGYRFVGQVRTVAAASRTSSSAASFQLVWGRKRFPLKEGGNEIGRNPDAEISIAHSSVSWRHARIVVAGTTVTLEDLGSKNGTSLRGMPLEAPSPVADGDTIGIGSVFLVLRPGNQHTSTKTARHS